MSERKYGNKGYEILPLEDIEFADLEAWVTETAKPDDILLVHADDGVIWGEMRGNTLHTSHDISDKTSPPLRLETLQELRLFNADREIKLWRVNGVLHGHTLSDIQSTEKSSLDEEHLLWGTRATEKDGFLLMRDGEGLRHIIPNRDKLDADDIQENKRLCLKVRHYLQENDAGVNSIAISRLVGLGVMSHD